MAYRAARRALKPAEAEALEALGFTRRWPVFIEREALWGTGRQTAQPHDLALALGLDSEPQRSLSSGRSRQLAQWPFESLSPEWRTLRARAIDLDSIRVIRHPGHLMEPRADVHAFLLEGTVVPEGCAIRILISKDGWGEYSPPPHENRAPIYTQVEYGEPETDLDQFWSYSRKGF